MSRRQAYIFGFFFGRTPLIKLSPKKTWEGAFHGIAQFVERSSAVRAAWWSALTALAASLRQVSWGH
jgi:CDP-diglyceride synthetase